MIKKNIIETLDQRYSDEEDVDLSTLVDFLLKREQESIDLRFKGFVQDLMDEYLNSPLYNRHSVLEITNNNVTLRTTRSNPDNEFLLDTFESFCKVYEFTIDHEYIKKDAGQFQRLIFKSTEL